MADDKRKLRSCSSNKENKMNNKKQNSGKEKNDKRNASKDRNANNKKVKTGNKNSPIDQINDEFIGKCSFNNIVNVCTNLQKGLCKPSTLKQVAEEYYTRNLKWFQAAVDQFSTEDLRVTALKWHPTIPDVFILGGKGGSFNLYSTHEDKACCGPFINGIGPGGAVEEIRFNPKNPDIEIITASVDGTVSVYDFEKLCRTATLIASAQPLVIWFCSVDLHKNGKSVYAGDNKGTLYIHQLDSNKTEMINKLHTSKIKHLEFNPSDPNFMVTASLDKTVKLWDIRMLKGKDDYVHCLPQDFSITSATFSKTDGCRLLTTDTLGELRVYKAPDWRLEHKIQHPHRVFQHLTSIRASWHPRADVFVIGRYPSRGDLDFRSVDVYSASTGCLVNQLLDTTEFIKSICEFNCTGTILATSSGSKVTLWNKEHTYYTY